MIELNVTHFPEPLERLAKLIPRDIERCKMAVKKTEEGRREWIEAAYDLCVHLAAAKAARPALIEFGQWCNDNGFGEEIINRNTRAAAIAMAEQPEALRKCLEETIRRSLDTIHKFDFGRFHNVMKTSKPPRKHKPRTEDKQRETAEAIRPLIEAGGSINRGEIAEQLGVSEATVQRAVQRERGRLEGLEEQPPIDPADMRDIMRKRYDAAVKAARKEIRAEIEAEIATEYFRMVDDHRRKVERAERIIASHKGVFSREEFRKIKACLHPDHNSFAFAADAMHIFSEQEGVLVKPEPPPAMSGPGALPRTVEELLARRRHPQRAPR